jgi:hypothetical protein
MTGLGGWGACCWARKTCSGGKGANLLVWCPLEGVTEYDGDSDLSFSLPWHLLQCNPRVREVVFPFVTGSGSTAPFGVDGNGTFHHNGLTSTLQRKHRFGPSPPT